MYKIFIILAIIACVSCKPAIVPASLAYSAPLVASVPASAVVSREYHGNGFVSPYVAAAAPYVASPYAAAYSAPLVAAPSAYSAYSAYPTAYSSAYSTYPAAYSAAYSAYPYAAAPVVF